MDNRAIYLSRAEIEFVDWQYSDHRESGRNFTQKLYDVVIKADYQNLERLARGFPEEVEVVRRFRFEAGYWDDLKDRYSRKLGIHLGY